MSAVAPVPEPVPEPAEPAARAPRRSMTDRLLPFADEVADVYMTPQGRPAGVLKDAPGRILLHCKPSALVHALLDLFYARDGSWPDSKASAALTSYLEVKAGRVGVRPTPLRCIGDGTRILLDHGGPDWRVIEITAGGCVIHDAAPEGVAFRRSPMTAAFPEPAARGDLGALWRLVPIAVEDRSLLLAVMILAWMTGTAQPVTMWVGVQGAGKTVTAVFVLSLIDPVTFTRGGSVPSREDQWKARLNMARVLLLDNASAITAAQSDMLCVVSTGGEGSARTLYSDDTAHVTDLLAPVHLTSIGVGALRGDLASRLVRFEVRPFAPGAMRVLSDLTAEQDAARPAIFRGLLDLTVQVMRVLPTVDRTNLKHRLTDLEVVVRAVDQVFGTDGAGRLVGQADDLADDVVDADPVALALLAAARTGAVLGDHTPSEVLEILTTQAVLQRTAHTPGWPRTPKVLSEHLQRVAPALLAAHRIVVTPTHKTNGRRVMTVERATEAQP